MRVGSSDLADDGKKPMSNHDPIALYAPGNELEQILHALDSAPEAFFAKDKQHRWIAFNQAFCTILGVRREQILGKSDHDVFPSEQATLNWAIDDEIFATGQAHFAETVVEQSDGTQKIVWTRKYPIRTTNGEINGVIAMSTEITELNQRLRAAERVEAENREQSRVIEAQKQVIRALAMPVLEIDDGLLLVPLVGELDAERSEQLMETLLNAVVGHRAQMVILDVTGLPAIDTESVGRIERAVAAVALLGARTTLVGIGPVMARALVEGGADLKGVRTAATLKQGIALARERAR